MGSPRTANPALFIADNTKITNISEADGKLCVTYQAKQLLVVVRPLIARPDRNRGSH